MPRAVRRRQRRGNLRAVARDLAQRQRSARQAIRERLPLEEFHDDEIEAVLLTDVVHRADVRMVQAGDEAGFPREAHPRVIVDQSAVRPAP